jgi:hypothetical protein
MPISDDYVTVAERLAIFKDKYPEGSLRPLNPEKPYDIIQLGDKMFVVVVAAAYRNAEDKAAGVGMAWEQIPALQSGLRGSELMVCETSAWGRAIVAALAADTKRSVASADEVINRGGGMTVEKVSTMFPKSKVVPSPARPPSAGGGTATQKQVNFIERLAKERGLTPVEAASGFIGRELGDLSELTAKEASTVIDSFMNDSAPPAAKQPAPKRPPTLDEEPF